MAFFEPNVMREIIMDHYQYPRNHELVSDDSYNSKHMASDSCIDDIYVQSKIEDEIIKDIRFNGTACTIATSSTSIMSELLIGKSTNEAKNIIKNYMNMIEEKEYDENLLEEANAFCNLGKQSNRIKCGTIGWKAISSMIEESENNHD